MRSMGPPGPLLPDRWDGKPSPSFRGDRSLVVNSF
jgi:hypothetical protein